MDAWEINEYIRLHEAFISYGINRIKRAFSKMGRRYNASDLEDYAQELRIVEYKCLQHFSPRYNTTIRTYIESSIGKYVLGIVRTQHKEKHTKLYYSAYFSDKVESGDGYQELIDTVADDQLPDEPRLDSVILSEGLLSLLPEAEREMVQYWIDWISYESIGEMYGIGIWEARYSIVKIIGKLRKVVDTQLEVS
jgi:RNA polymerase sigma factor (sigma-70 family)